MEANALTAEVMDFLRDPAGDRFEELALAVSAHQYGCNAGYRAYCDALGRTPGRVRSWREIPALPADAFKCEPAPFCGDPATAVRCFLSSGTTGEVRSRHYFRELGTYRAAILGGWHCGGLPELGHTAFISRPPGSHPDSSLMFMWEVLGEAAAAATWLLDAGGAPAYPGFAEVPLILFGTSLNLLDYLGRAPEEFSLPPGSHVFQTGGYKGLQREADPGRLASLLAAKGVTGDRVIHEYGMTELSSQAYARGDGAPFHCPPWMRVRVIDPATGKEQEDGVNGYLEVVDLANIGSVAAVRTQDIARAVDSGSFVLVGRDPGALPRGCSRSSAAALSTP